MMTPRYILLLVAAVVVLLEALNKLERADLFDGRALRQRIICTHWLLRPWAWKRDRVVTVLKAAGWALLAWGAFASALHPDPPAWHVAILGGFALLIVRSRLKEG